METLSNKYLEKLLKDGIVEMKYCSKEVKTSFDWVIEDIEQYLMKYGLFEIDDDYSIKYNIRSSDSFAKVKWYKNIIIINNKEKLLELNRNIKLEKIKLKMEKNEFLNLIYKIKR